MNKYDTFIYKTVKNNEPLADVTNTSISDNTSDKFIPILLSEI